MTDLLTNVNLTDVTSLHLRNLELTSADAISIASELKTNSTSKLTSISLIYNSIGDVGAIALTEIFSKSIQVIGMVGC
ncbi:hypothetical protein N9515_01960 [Vicingaceae bacterium]|nr:hypothetical protein [Vicingaceae bacterium]MDB4060707.1 hypothetical protein [Vicingaceae bacterium]